MNQRVRTAIGLGMVILLFGAIALSVRHWAFISTMERPADEITIMAWLISEQSREEREGGKERNFGTDFQLTRERLSGWQHVRRWPSWLDRTKVCHGPYLVFWDGDPTRPFRQGVYEDGFEVRTTQWASDGSVVWQVAGGRVNHGPDWWWGAVPWSPTGESTPRD